MPQSKLAGTICGRETKKVDGSLANSWRSLILTLSAEMGFFSIVSPPIVKEPLIKSGFLEGEGLQCLRENLTCQITLERKAIETGCSPAAQRRNEVSPARKRRVEWEIEPSRAAATRFSRRHFRPSVNTAISTRLQPPRDFGLTWIGIPLEILIELHFLQLLRGRQIA